MVIAGQVLIPQPGYEPRIPYSRVVFIQANENAGRTIYLAPLIHDRKRRKGCDRMPVPVAESAIDEAIESKAVRVSQWLPPATKLPDEQISKYSLAIRDHAWARIAPLVDTPAAYARLFSDKRFSIVCERAAAIQKSEFRADTAQIFRDLRRFFRNGMNRNACLPDFNTVAKGTQQEGGAKRGPKFRIPVDGRTGPGIAVTAAVRQRIENALLAKVTQNTTWTDLFDAAQKAVCWRQEPDETGRLQWIEPCPDERLSEMQVRHIFNKLDRDNAMRRSMIGAKEFRNKHKERLHCSHADLSGPGARYEIDATGSQIDVLSEFDRRPIGTALIYLVVDTWSNAIVGYYCGLASAKADSAMLALHQAFSDKVAYCREYGIEITPEEWPMSGRAWSTISDHGSDFSSKAYGDALMGAHFDGAQARAGEPPHRADGERTNGTMKTQWTRKMPGWHAKFGGGRRQARKEACFTLYELHQELIRWILWFNRYQALTLTAIPGVARLSGTFTNRNDLWNWGMRNCTGFLTQVSADQLHTELLPSVEATFTKQGLRVGKRYYACEEMIRLGLFSAATLHDLPKTSVRYHPSLPNIVHWYFDLEDRHFECRLIDNEDQYTRYSLEDAERQVNAHHAAVVAQEFRKQDARIQLADQQQKAIRRAKARNREAQESATDPALPDRLTIKGRRSVEEDFTQRAMHDIAKGSATHVEGVPDAAKGSSTPFPFVDDVMGDAFDDELARHFDPKRGGATDEK